MNLKSLRETGHGDPNRKLFCLKFHLTGGQTPFERDRICGEAEGVYREYRFHKGTLGIDQAQAPDGSWSSKAGELLFTGVNYPGSEINRRFFLSDRLSVNACETLAKIVGTKIWKELAQHGRDTSDVQLEYQGNYYIFHLTPEQVAVTTS